ncbi:hypothetical protein [Micromonospora saelicesensis]|nr:hypothetical protein [Micromonospora saelicesensis]
MEVAVLGRPGYRDFLEVESIMERVDRASDPEPDKSRELSG